MTSRVDIAVAVPEVSGAALPSAAMAELLARSGSEAMTLGSLLQQSPSTARETLIFVIALIALVPGASLPAGVALILLALPMIFGGRVWLPRRLAARPIPAASLGHVISRLLPLLRWQERIFAHSGVTRLAATRPFIAVLLLALSAMLLVPLPLSNLAPALAIAMIAIAYLEASAVLLAVSALTGLLALALTGSVVWAALGGAHLLFG